MQDRALWLLRHLQKEECSSKGLVPGQAGVPGRTRTAWASLEQRMACGGRHLVITVQSALQEAGPSFTGITPSTSG